MFVQPTHKRMKEGVMIDLTPYYVVVATAAFGIYWYRFALKAARIDAWEWAISPNAWKNKDPKEAKTLLFALPSIESEREPNHYINMSHLPLYAGRFLFLLLIQIPRFVVYQAGLYSQILPAQDISDSQVFDLVIKTSLILCAHLSKDASELSIELPQDMTGFSYMLDADSPCVEQMGGLVIVFDVGNKNIKQAVGGNGVSVEQVETYSRNMQLVTMLNMMMSTCLHPTSHVAAEYCAKEIGLKKVQPLEPSSRFVFGLHQGLFYTTTLSPIAGNCVGNCVGMTFIQRGGVEGIRHNVKERPIPAHDLDERKGALSPLFHFWLHSHSIVFKLVRKYSLDVNAENLFLNIVVHSLDHVMTYEALKPIDMLFGFHGTCALRDLFSAYWYINFWLLPLENIFDSELVRNMKHPFYQELYVETRKINPYLADQMVTSCSF